MEDLERIAKCHRNTEFAHWVQEEKAKFFRSFVKTGILTSRLTCPCSFLVEKRLAHRYRTKRCATNSRWQNSVVETTKQRHLAVWMKPDVGTTRSDRPRAPASPKTPPHGPSQR